MGRPRAADSRSASSSRYASFPHPSMLLRQHQRVAEGLRPVRAVTESKPQRPQQSTPLAPVSLEAVVSGRKRGAADIYGVSPLTASQVHLAGIKDAPKPARTKKKKSTEKNPTSSTPRDDANDAFDDDYGDGFDVDVSEGSGGKDLKRQMRCSTTAATLSRIRPCLHS